MTILNPNPESEYAAERAFVKSYLDRVPAIPAISDDQADALKEKIKHLLAERNAVMVAHYYTDAQLQSLAEESGGFVADSLEMARFGNQTDAETIVVAGVKFMAFDDYEKASKNEVNITPNSYAFWFKIRSGGDLGQGIL